MQNKCDLLQRSESCKQIYIFYIFRDFITYFIIVFFFKFK